MRRFSLRDVLWLIALVAVALGWWMDHVALKTEFELERNQHEALSRDYGALFGTVKILEEDLKKLESEKKD